MTAVALQGDINLAIAFGKTKIGKWSYDHDAAENTRFGQTDKMADCSGLVSRCLWEGGMPRNYAGLGESSNAFAAWVLRHPEFRIPLWKAASTFGAIWVVGGLAGAGDRGHTGFSLGDGSTLESASGLNGVQIGRLSRLKLSDALYAPVHYDGLPVPAPQPPEEETDMAQADYFITTSGTEVWWFYNGNSKRALRPGENQQLVDLGIVRRKEAKRIDPDVLKAIPDFK